jgi:hypothetical protein
MDDWGLIPARDRDLFPLHHVQTGSSAYVHPIQWVPVALSLGVKELGHEIDHSPPFTAEIKNVANETVITLPCHHLPLPYWMKFSFMLNVHCSTLKSEIIHITQDPLGIILTYYNLH